MYKKKKYVYTVAVVDGDGKLCIVRAVSKAPCPIEVVKDYVSSQLKGSKIIFAFELKDRRGRKRKS